MALRYPASDIPAIARTLYLKKPPVAYREG
jgi:light-regulated signal transduction histidine kinase (bacteriophytochrome)